MHTHAQRPYNRTYLIRTPNDSHTRQYVYICIFLYGWKLAGNQIWCISWKLPNHQIRPVCLAICTVHLVAVFSRKNASHSPGVNAWPVTQTFLSSPWLFQRWLRFIHTSQKRSPISDISAAFGSLHQCDEGSQRLPKRLKFVTFFGYCVRTSIISELPRHSGLFKKYFKGLWIVLGSEWVFSQT